jgi:hypothetical protein
MQQHRKFNCFKYFLIPIIVCIVSIGSVGLGELYLRVFYKKHIVRQIEEMKVRRNQAEKEFQGPIDFPLHRFYRLHPYYGFVGRPHMKEIMQTGRFETDGYGFRNWSDFDYQKVSVEKVVIGLFGGSAAWGTGIDGNEGTLAQQLESLLKNSKKSRVFHVVNLAQGAWHQPQQFFLLSRVIQYLDGIIFFDGYNEILMPFRHTVRDGLPLPPDYPNHQILHPLFVRHNAAMSMATLGLLRFESEYEPTRWWAQSALYNWFRYRRYAKIKATTLKKLSTPLRQRELIAYAGEKHFDPKTTNADEMLEFGLDEHEKYSRMADLVAIEYGVPIVHVTQPFRYADGKTPMSKDRIETPLPKERHPSIYYQRLRKRMEKIYGNVSGEKGIIYVDLSEALSPDDENWIDCIHFTPKGCGKIASKIFSELQVSGVLAKLDSLPTPRSRNLRRIVPEVEYKNN